MENIDVTDLSDQELDLMIAKFAQRSKSGKIGNRNLTKAREERSYRKKKDEVCGAKAEENDFKYDKRKRGAYIFRDRYMYPSGKVQNYADGKPKINPDTGKPIKKMVVVPPTCYPAGNAISKNSNAAKALKIGFKVLGKSVEEAVNQKYSEGICPSEFGTDGDKKFIATDSAWRIHGPKHWHGNKKPKRCLLASAKVREANPDLVSDLNLMAWCVNGNQKSCNKLPKQFRDGMTLKQAKQEIFDKITVDAVDVSGGVKSAITRKMKKVEDK